MDEEKFWKIVDHVAKAGDEAAKAGALKIHLMSLDRNEIVDFQCEFEKKMDRLDRGEIWAAAAVISGGYCSDDNFEYFRNWLISLGRKIYEDAERDPDSLANVDLPIEEGRPNPTNEDYGYSAAKAYFEVSNERIYDELNRKCTALDLDSGAASDWETYTEEVIQKRFPKLWKKYKKFWKKAAAGQTDETDEHVEENSNNNVQIDVEGLGVIRIGSKVSHKKHGEGIVKDINFEIHPSAIIEYTDETRTTVLSPAFLTIISK